MKSVKKSAVTALICICLTALAYEAWRFPFYEFETDSYTLSSENFSFTAYLKALTPLLIIIVLSGTGILLSVLLRKHLMKNDSRLANLHRHRKAGTAPKQKLSAFMVIRWIIMIVFSFMMIWGD